MYSEQTLAPPGEEQLLIDRLGKNKAENAVRQRWYQLIVQFSRFSIVGVVNTLLDLCLFNTLLWLLPTRNTLLILGYNSLAYAIGAINSFLLNKYWTFQRTHTTTPGEVVRFILTTIVGILCSDLILWVAGLFLSSIPGNTALLNNLAKLLAIMGTVGVSYLGMRLWVFVRKSEG